MFQTAGGVVFYCLWSKIPHITTIDTQNHAFHPITISLFPSLLWLMQFLQHHRKKTTTKKIEVSQNEWGPPHACISEGKLPGNQEHEKEERQRKGCSNDLPTSELRKTNPLDVDVA